MDSAFTSLGISLTINDQSGVPASAIKKAPSPEELDRILSSNWWYHQFDLTDGRKATGRYGENLIPVAYLIRHVDLRGKQCLDIGAMDGKMSFWMEQAGGRVLSVDGIGKETVSAMINAYGSTVRYRSGIVLEQLPDLIPDEGLFDFVLCSGVAYHVYSPFDLIANVRQLLRTGGMALFDTFLKLPRSQTIRSSS